MAEQLLVYGGTKDSRTLAEGLAAGGWDVTLCVATEYGREQVVDRTGLQVRAGRQTEEEMAALIASAPFRAVIDGTHPYAAEVTANVKAAAAEAGLPYFRLVRPEAERNPDWTEVPDMEAAVDWLAEHPGRVLLTTGSKDLGRFAQLPDFQERIYARILPNLDSLSHALELGYPGRHLICMQGPFSEELNAAMLRQTGASLLVTKDTGDVGGFAEKVRAARAAGAHVLVVRRPVQETGWTSEELLAHFLVPPAQ